MKKFAKSSAIFFSLDVSGIGFSDVLLVSVLTFLYRLFVSLLQFNMRSLSLAVVSLSRRCLYLVCSALIASQVKSSLYCFHFFCNLCILHFCFFSFSDYHSLFFLNVILLVSSETCLSRIDPKGVFRCFDEFI